MSTQFLVGFSLVCLAAARTVPRINRYDAYKLDRLVDYAVKPLSPEDAEALANWNENSKQNIWELSGQFEGDIVLDPGQRNGLIKEKYRWNNLEIPYEFDSVFDDEQKDWIVQSLDEFHKKTCIKPRLRKDSDVDYVLITGAATGCHSKVGRRGGMQTLNLALNSPGKGCMRHGTIVHEFLHALGFYHQQSTSDRDDYVDIVWDNIKDGHQHNFNKYDSDTVTQFGEKYDYGSVLHYSAYSFSKNGEKTIVTKDPDAEIGQRAGMSEVDVRKLNKMYGCE